MRALWKGSISFGLVNIPVKMFTASREQELKFIMLHKKDMSQIRYAKMCKQEEKEVPWEEIVKGFEYEPGEYVVLNDEDFQKANLAKSKAIEIVDFVKESEIDPLYYTKPYFLEPEKSAGRAYALLREALFKSKKVGIAKFVLHNREHLAVLKPYENVIVLNEMRYASEVIATDELTLPPKEPSSDKELAIALKLIDHLTTSFKPEKYKDTYIDEMKEIIEKKAKGKKIHPKGQEPKPSKVQDIMSLLKASLETPKGSSKKGKKQKTA